VMWLEFRRVLFRSAFENHETKRPCILRSDFAGNHCIGAARRNHWCHCD